MKGDSTMRRYLLCLGFVMVPLIAAAAEPAGEGWNDRLESPAGTYAVSVRPAEKRVEVRRVEGAGQAPFLRLRVLREGDRPFELHLRTVERAGEPHTYLARLPERQESYTGLQLEFSFDRKTWKRLGESLHRVLPPR